MGSEAPANTRIYFKDELNELKGPFTDRQVQKLYGEGRFNGSTSFYFMNKNESPGNDSKFLTLDALRTHNGARYPFNVTGAKEILKKIVDDMEKILSELSKRHDDSEEYFSCDDDIPQWVPSEKEVTIEETSLAIVATETSEKESGAASIQEEKIEEVHESVDQTHGDKEIVHCLALCAVTDTNEGSEAASSEEDKKEEVCESVKQPVPKKEEQTCLAICAVAATENDDVSKTDCKKELVVAPEAEKEKKKETVIPKLEEFPPRDKKREDELRKFNEWTDAFSDFYMIYVDGLETMELRRIFLAARAAVVRANLILASEEARLMCAEKIIEKVKKRKFIHCKLCQFSSFNYKQFFIHTLADELHVIRELHTQLEHPCFGQVTNVSHRIMGDLRSKWKAEEAAFIAEIKKKYASVRLDESSMGPDKNFALNREMRCSIMFLAMPTSPGGEWNFPINIPSMANLVTSVSGIFKESGFAALLNSDLHENIGSKMTCCLVCMEVTGTREEYYKHLMLTTHLRKSAVSKTYLFHLMAVNMLKQDLAL